MKSHILLVASGSDLAGGEKNLFDIAQFLVGQGGWQVSAVVTGVGRLGDELRRLGADVEVIPLSTFIRPATILRLAQLIRDSDIDLVHAHGTRAAFYARPAARFARIPSIYTVHGIHYLHYSSIRRLLYVILERYMKRWTAKTIFVCESDRREGLAARITSPTASAVIYNGVELRAGVDREAVLAVREELGLAEREKMILSVGRFHRQKGQMFLVEAAAIALGQRDDMRFVMVGDGDTLPEVKQRAVLLGVDDRIDFVGARKDIAALMEAADLFALPSLWEGLPYVLLEAALVGLPMVASDVDGISEVVEDGKTGFLVEPGNPSQMAQTILEALDQDAQALTKLAVAAKELVLSRFSMEVMNDKIAGVYKDALS